MGAAMDVAMLGVCGGGVKGVLEEDSVSYRPRVKILGACAPRAERDGAEAFFWVSALAATPRFAMPAATAEMAAGSDFERSGLKIQKIADFV
jgi:hypothetical protein